MVAGDLLPKHEDWNATINACGRPHGFVASVRAPRSMWVVWGGRGGGTHCELLVSGSAGCSLSCWEVLDERLPDADGKRWCRVSAVVAVCWSV
jgi:hypothetical protein